MTRWLITLAILVAALAASLASAGASPRLPPSPPDVVFWTSDDGRLERRARTDGSTYQLNTDTGALVNLTAPTLCTPRPECYLP